MEQVQCDVVHCNATPHADPIRRRVASAKRTQHPSNIRRNGETEQPLIREQDLSPRGPILGPRALRALSGQIEPFDRDDFASWPGALRMAMPEHRQRCATTPRRKSTRPPVGGASRLPGFVATLARFSDSENQASRFTPRLPGKPICRHQIDSIWSDSALGGPRSSAPFHDFARFFTVHVIRVGGCAWIPARRAPGGRGFRHRRRTQRARGPDDASGARVRGRKTRPPQNLYPGRSPDRIIVFMFCTCKAWGKVQPARSLGAPFAMPSDRPEAFLHHPRERPATLPSIAPPAPFQRMPGTGGDSCGPLVH